MKLTAPTVAARIARPITIATLLSDVRSALGSVADGTSDATGPPDAASTSDAGTSDVAGLEAVTTGEGDEVALGVG